MINYSLVDKGSESSEIKELVQDLKNKQYVFGIIPEKIIHMNNGIKYYYVEAEINKSKVIITLMVDKLNNCSKFINIHF
jgi:hypothetical protein